MRLDMYCSHTHKKIHQSNDLILKVCYNNVKSQLHEGQTKSQKNKLENKTNHTKIKQINKQIVKLENKNKKVKSYNILIYNRVLM